MSTASVPVIKLLHTLEGHPKPVADLGLTADGRTLVSAAADSSILCWSIPDGAQTRVLHRSLNPIQQQLSGDHLPTRVLAVAPDGSLAATANSSVAFLWDLATGKRLRKRATFSISALAFSPDTTRLAIATSPPRWLAAPGTRAVANAAIAVLAAASGNVGAAGSNVMDQPGSLRIWDQRLDNRLWVPVWKELGDKYASGTLPGVTAVAFSPDGRGMAVGTSLGTVKLVGVELPPGEPSWWARLNQNAPETPVYHVLQCGGPVRGVGFVLEARCVAVAVEDRIQLWDLTTQTRLGEAVAPGRIAAFAAPPAGSLLATTSEGEEAVVRLWNLRTGQPAQVLAAESPVQALAVSASGTVLAAGGEDGKIRVWQIAGGETETSHRVTAPG